MAVLSVLERLAAHSRVLQLKMRNARAFEIAVEEGYIVVADDGQHLRWTLGSDVLLAYFCGRVWCGDRGFRSRRKGKCVWRLGDGVFPAAELGRLFGLSALKQKRNNRKNMALPGCYQLVDNLFVN